MVVDYSYHGKVYQNFNATQKHHASTAEASTSRTTTWDYIDEQLAQLPENAWDNSPTDGSYQHDHYLYGIPKRDCKTP